MMLQQLRFLAIVGAVATAVVASPAAKKQKPVTKWSEDDDDDTPLPLVIWHGLGDNFAAEGIRRTGDLAEAVNEGTFVYYVHLADDAASDRSDSFFGNVTAQVEKVCADLAAHPILSTAPAIDALGFSQGGQFLRAYVERCNFPPVRSLVTFGSQHNGISRFRDCGSSDWLCKAAMALLRGNTWSSFVQSRLVPAQYLRDPSTQQSYDDYLAYSNFLADINNERPVKNMTYRENLAKLEQFVMYIFDEDTTVVPKETAWFEEVNGTEVMPLRMRPMYTEDWLGLKKLDEKGALKFRVAPGEHMELTEAVLNETFREFYGPLKKTFTRDPEVAVPYLDEL